MKLSTIYRVVPGDTFELIARKKYGSEIEAGKISRSNPGVSEPLTPGTSVVIPDTPSAPRNVQQRSVSSNDNETAILIDGTRFRFWDRVRITRAVDTIDTIEFSAPFDASSGTFRSTFQPFSYKSIEVTVGGDPIFTGTMVGVNPVVENNSKIIAISGYSTPGILNDCTSPASSLLLEFDNQTLPEIIDSLVLPFGIDVDFQAAPGPVFDCVAIEAGEKVLSFIIKLAKQRNLILSSSNTGKLIVHQPSATGSPVAKLAQGSSPVLAVTPFFSPQEYYSHITGIEPVFVGLAGSQFTVKNPRLTGIMRPLTFSVPDIKDSTLQVAVEAKSGRMFGSLVAYAVRVNTWRDANGNLWLPNTIVDLIAPDAMIYDNYEFIVRSVEFEKDSVAETAILNLVLPGSFSGSIPESMPWE